VSVANIAFTSIERHDSLTKSIKHSWNIPEKLRNVTKVKDAKNQEARDTILMGTQRKQICT